jgi:hypothetical protein
MSSPASADRTRRQAKTPPAERQLGQMGTVLLKEGLLARTAAYVLAKKPGLRCSRLR